MIRPKLIAILVVALAAFQLGQAGAEATSNYVSGVWRFTHAADYFERHESVGAGADSERKNGVSLVVTCDDAKGLTFVLTDPSLKAPRFRYVRQYDILIKGGNAPALELTGTDRLGGWVEIPAGAAAARLVEANRRIGVRIRVSPDRNEDEFFLFDPLNEQGRAIFARHCES